jgi:fucose permease
VLSAPAWASNSWTLAAGLLLVGLTDGVLNVAMNARANAVEDARGTPILSTCHGFFSVGGMLGAGIGSATAALGIPLGASLVGIGLVGVAVIGAHRHGLLDGLSTLSAGPVVALPNRALLGLALLAFCVLLCEGAVSNWSAVYLRNGLGTSAAVAALGYASFSFAMAIGRFYGDRLTGRFGARRVVQIGGLLAAFGLWGGALVGHPVAALLGFALMGLGYATLIPVLFRAAAQAPGLAPGTSLAAVASAGYLGLFVGPPALGGVADGWGLSWVIGLLAVLSAFVAGSARWVLAASTTAASADG